MSVIDNDCRNVIAFTLIRHFSRIRGVTSRTKYIIRTLQWIGNLEMFDNRTGLGAMLLDVQGTENEVDSVCDMAIYEHRVLLLYVIWRAMNLEYLYFLIILVNSYNKTTAMH
jgi:hypothetical protein